jgi:hypothetical protein
VLFLFLSHERQEVSDDHADDRPDRFRVQDTEQAEDEKKGQDENDTEKPDSLHADGGILPYDLVVHDPDPSRHDEHGDKTDPKLCRLQ